MPVFKNLRLTVRRRGFANDTAELLAALPAVQQRASRAFPHSEEAITAFQPNLNFFRAYTPDLFNGFARLGQVSAPYDGNGHYVRSSFSGLNLFNYNSGSRALEPIAPSEQYDAFGPSAGVKTPLPRRRQPARRRRLQPLRRTALQRLRRDHLRLQPGRRATRPMRKAIVIGGLVAAAIVAIVLISSGGGGSDGYVVRAIFDSGGFMVKGEQVRVAGANVGEIESVGVTMPGEVDSYEGGKEQAIDGKAVIVMKITDPGFQDFRSDAGCQIRPQSLIGEKFVDCRPTLPRAPGAQPAPPLKEIPDGQPGAGQLLLPLENNSTSVDPDLINDINKLPYAQRFRLIFNELGAGLAGRGADIEAAVKRANPALRDVDQPARHPQRPARPADPARRRLRADPRAALARTRPASPASSPTPAPPPRRRPNAARTWKPRCRSSPPSCASSARRCAACRASPTRPRRPSPRSARRHPRSPKRPAC